MDNSDTGIEKLEFATEESNSSFDVAQMLDEYRKLYAKPLWRLVEHIQQQAMMYTNIIEQIKRGDTAPDIRARFENLGLVPKNLLPNPSIPALLKKALDKVATYRRALVDIVRNLGGELLNELEFETESKVIVGVNVGFPPSISIAVEHSAKTKTTVRF